MAIALAVDKVAFFFRNRFDGQDNISANVSHGNTIHHIKDPILGRACQLSGNDATLTIEIKSPFQTVDAIHIVADLRASATITASSADAVGGAYTQRHQVVLGTYDSNTLYTTGGYEDPEERGDVPGYQLYSLYLDPAITDDPFWQIQLDDPGQSATSALKVRRIYGGPAFQFTGNDGYPIGSVSIGLVDESEINRERGITSGNVGPVLREFSFSLKTTVEADLFQNFLRDVHLHGTHKPFFIAFRPSEGTIQDATNYREKWLTAYVVFTQLPAFSTVAGFANTYQSNQITVIEAR